MKLLLAHPWYGNVRQLENVVERAMVLSEGPVVRPRDLPDFIRHPETSVEGPFEALPADELSIKKQTAELERRLIGRALQVTDGNRTKLKGNGKLPVTPSLSLQVKPKTVPPPPP